MSIMQLIALAVFILIILFLILPVTVYMITKAIYDAKFKSIQDNSKKRKGDR